VHKLAGKNSWGHDKTGIEAAIILHFPRALSKTIGACIFSPNIAQENTNGKKTEAAMSPMLNRLIHQRSLREAVRTYARLRLHRPNGVF
jgi:hypothetical protein